MKKSLEGYLYNKIEEFGKEKYVHVGFEDEKGQFEKMLAGFVPEPGMKKRVRLTIEILEESSEKTEKERKNKK